MVVAACMTYLLVLQERAILMSKATLMELSAENKEQLCFVARALSSPVRVDILKLLYQRPMSIQQVSQELGLPQSSAGMHIAILRDAGILRAEKIIQNGKPCKIFRVEKFLIHIGLRVPIPEIDSVTSVHIPIGSYWDCYAQFPCGLISEKSIIGVEDELKSFYLPERQQAQLIWMRYGFLEYRIANPLPNMKQCKKVNISMELCSEAPGYNENYPSDISLSINGVFCGDYHALGDHGRRRGILTPDFWPNGLTQYGDLVKWCVTDDGTFINDALVSDTCIKKLNLECKPYITFRLESRKDAKHCGGMNLFGEKAGDYRQGIEVSFLY